MAQQRYINYKDTNSSYDINQRWVGIVDKGRYRGFEANLGLGMILTLDHTLGSGIEKVNFGGLSAATYGLWVTTQGTVVTESAAINLPIAAADPTNPRIDIIVGQHNYQSIIGGSIATYVVITGTPAASPVAPALTLPFQQVVLGTLYVPAAIVNLSAATYTPATVPNYGGDGTIAHLDREQLFTAMQTLSGTAHTYSTITTINGSNEFELPDDRKLDFYIFAPSVPPPVTTRTSIAGIDTVASVIDAIKSVTIYTPYALKLLASWLGQDYYIEPNNWFTVYIDDIGVWRFGRGDSAKISSVNKYQKTQINKVTSIASVLLDSAGRLSISSNGNIIYLNNNATPLNQLRAIGNSNSLIPTNTEGGAILDIIPIDGADITITPFDFTFAPSYKPIWTPNGLPIHHRGGTIIRLVEDVVYWRVQSWEPAWVSFVTTINSVTGGTAVLNSITYRYRVTGNKVEINVVMNITFNLGVTSFQLPIPAVVYTMATGADWAVPFSYFGRVGNAQNQGATSIIFTPLISDGTFANGTYQVYLKTSWQLPS